MNRIVHFEIHAVDPQRTAQFYHAVFGWDIKEWVIPGVSIPQANRYWLITTGGDGEPGINGGMVVRRGAAPSNGQAVNAYVCTIGVDSVDVTVGKALAAGATIALPKMPVKGVGWLAYCHDTEGNIFGVMQADPLA